LAIVRVVLVRPETSQNVGAAARAVRNAGLAGLDLVRPGSWRSVECWRSAWGAHDVLEEARVFEDLRQALAGSGVSVAFSGRSDNGPPPRDVREIAAEIAALGSKEEVALVFGPESAGLSGEEIARCGRRARIPAHADQPSLNLSHAVMVAAYEVFRAGRAAQRAPRLATHDEKERMLGLLRGGLLAIGALPGSNTDGYFKEWRALFQRVDLTPRELRLLEHMARKMATREAHLPSRKPASRSGRAAGAPPPPREAPRSARAGAPDAAGRRDEATRTSEDAGQGDAQQPFADVRLEPGGFSIPELKWRELLFVGAIRREGEAFVRDPQVPLPPFREPGLFPEGVRLGAREAGGRVLLRPL
jgi:tRNA/rRNA methyltransferase